MLLFPYIVALFFAHMVPSIAPAVASTPDVLSYVHHPALSTPYIRSSVNKKFCHIGPEQSGVAATAGSASHVVLAVALIALVGMAIWWWRRRD
jgi:hypothetical protein